MTANRFVCVNSIHNPCVNPELMNTNYPENKGTLNETFLLNNNKFKRWYFEKITRNQNTSNMHTSDIGKIEQQ